MKTQEKKTDKKRFQLLKKNPAGITRLAERTLGGLPKGRPTLVCGSAGCGKTLMGLEFLMPGALGYGTPGIFMAFEEPESEITHLSAECNRVLFIFKSRGVPYCNQVREFVLSNKGVSLVDVYIGPGNVLEVSGRLAQECRDKGATQQRKKEIERRQRQLSGNAE